MKTTFFSMAILCSLSYNVKATYFQSLVVAGEVNESATGKLVENLEFFKNEQTLIISTHGYLAIVDNKTNIFEFYGPKTILLDTLYGHSLKANFPNFKALYLESLPISAVRHCGDEINILYPFLFSMEMSVGKEVILQWASDPQGSGKYVVKLTSIYGDALSKTEVVGNELKIKLTPDQIKEREIVIEMGFSGDKKKDLKETKILFVGTPEHKLNDVTSDLNSAAGCLMKGFFLEQNYKLQEAKAWFAKATQIAPEVSTYQTILSNFTKRHL